jgi:tetratricopeptide (TPR) repeat protein
MPHNLPVGRKAGESDMIRRVGCLVCLLIGLLPCVAWAQGWQVTRLKVAGAPATVAPVQWRAGGAGEMRSRDLRVNDSLADGDELRAAAHVEIELHSPRRVRMLKESGDPGLLRLESSGPAGDAVEVRQGRWSFSRVTAGLAQKLDPFSARAGSAAARTEGTEFTVAVDESAGLARFRVQEGAIKVSVPVQVEVAGGASIEGRLQRHLLKAGDPELSLPLSPNGWLRRFGNFDEALSAFEAQVRDAQARGDTDAQVDALMALGDMRLLAGRAQEAQAPFEQALALVPAPEDAYWQAVLQGRIGAALQGQNRFVAAAVAYRQSLARHEQLPRRDGEWTVEEQSTNIALNLAAAGTFRCADDWAQRLLRRLDELRAGPARHIRSVLLSTRGSAAHGLKRLDDARRWHRLALDIERTVAGIERNKATAGLVSALNLLGLDETAAGNWRAGEPLHREALGLVQTLFSSANPLKADTHLGLAEVHRARRQWPAALDEIRRARDILDALPADRARLGGAWLQQAEVLRDSGRAREAVQAYREARGHWAAVWPDASHPWFHEILLAGLAHTLRSAGAPAAEIAEVEEAARRGAQALQQLEAQCPS